jgi:hypothetical protein
MFIHACIPVKSLTAVSIQDVGRPLVIRAVWLVIEERIPENDLTNAKTRLVRRHSLDERR